MQPILSFVGKSNSGKTTLLAEVIEILKQHGFKIAVIKHAQQFELDTQGKDSWLFRRTGADTVVLSSPTELALLKEFFPIRVGLLSSIIGYTGRSC